jgi:NTP pyrophosphatase (non-canonical NTP hydrolase)
MSSMVDLWKWQKRIGYWCEQVFPEQTPESIEAHFQEEAQELSRAVLALCAYGSNPSTLSAVGEEIADCIILLIALAYRLGINASAELAKKMATNFKRKWEYSPKHGYHKKVETP